MDIDRIRLIRGLENTRNFVYAMREVLIGAVERTCETPWG